MEAHILNGDALAEKFPIAGEVIVCREAFIDGPVPTLGEQFWKERASYLTGTYKAEEVTYFVEVKTEFEKLCQLKNIEAINLWFEHDLFCQVNMWFILHYINTNKIDIPVFRAMPPPDMSDIWSGFGRMKAAELQNCFQHRIQMSKDDLQTGISLWEAFSKKNFDALKKISSQASSAYPFLREVCEAHIQRFPLRDGRPQNRLRQIKNSGVTDFHDIFKEFSRTEGIYGFGDLQVKEMLVSL
jgi:hypothetical protein